MRKNRSGAIALVAAVAMFMAAAAPAAASSVSVNVNTAKQTAVWHSQTALYVNFTYPNTSLISADINGTHGSIGINVTAHTNASASAAALLNGSVQADYQHAYVSNLSFYYNATWHANTTELSIVIRSALLMTVNGIGNNTSKALNMSWKDFNYAGTFDITTITNGTVNVNSPSSVLGFSTALDMFGSSGKQLSTYHDLNYSAFSVPLSAWKRSYNALSDRTTYSYNAGASIDHSYNLSLSKHMGNYVLSVYMDPAAHVVTNGNTYASGNTLYVRPSGMLGGLTYLIAGAVIVVIVGGTAAAILLRRRKKTA